MIITANPSTLVEFAHRADRQARIADSRHPRRHAVVRSAGRDPRLRCGERSAAATASGRGELERIVIGARRAYCRNMPGPSLSVLAVWTGGSVRIYLPQLADLYGETAIRDHGLSASEGRMTIPLADGTSAGLLDFYHHYFEFIPVEEHDSANPTVLEAHELEQGTITTSC